MRYPTDKEIIGASKKFSQRDAAKILGISLGKFQRKLRELGPAQEAADKQAAVLKQLTKEVDGLKAEIARRDAADHEAKLAGTMRFDPLVIPSEVHEKQSGGMPMTIWSDWHWGESVDRRETGGLNEFNREIAEKRVQNLVRNTVRLLRDHTGGVDNAIIVQLGGDMVSGLIHQELVETNWGNIADQCYECGGAIVGGLKALASEFGHVQLIAGVPGNHGRTTLKPTAKGRLDSYDRTIYKAVAAQLADDDRFTITVVDDIDYRFKVFNTTFLLTHGDSQGVKGGDGIIGPLGPIIRGLVKTKRAEAQVARDFDIMVEGHWHQYIPWSQAIPVIVNGTLKGYDEFARIVLRAPFAKPCQALWLVSPKHGIAAQWAVYL